jgi:CheY-like chemotaxis protein
VTESSVVLRDKLPLLLVIEDSNEDFEAFQRYVRKSDLKISIYRCIDGDEALEFLFHKGRFADSQSLPRPALVVLDLNLPGMDGREILGQIKQDEDLKSIPVVILTTSNNPKDIEACYQQGVNSYIVKPMDFNRLRHNIESLIDYWFDTTILPTDALEHK